MAYERPLVFLDCDGVLNNSTSYRVANYVRNYVDPLIEERLSNFVIENHAQVVVSSTWRLFQDRESFCQSFEPWMSEALHPCWRTPGGGGRRGPQIDQWFRFANEIGAIRSEFMAHVILDDNSDFGPHQPHIWIDPQYGLRDSDISKARKVLFP